MKTPSRPLQGAFCILLGIVSAMSFTVSPEGYAGMSAIPAAATSYLWSALAVCFALFFIRSMAKCAFARRG